MLSRTSTNKTPRLSGRRGAGMEGGSSWSSAGTDVGIVGAERRQARCLSLSNAKPRSRLSFTTLVPNLGVCDKLGYKSIVFADVPGLERAHIPALAWVRFPRHCEVEGPVQVIDGDSPDPLGDYLLSGRSRLFSETCPLPYIVAINKIDIPDVLDRTRGLQDYL